MPKIFVLVFSILLVYGKVLQAETLPLEDVIEEVNPSVVNIIANLSEEETSAGTGIIVGADGYVVTNAHVIENATEITAITQDEQVYKTKLIGTDTKTDIALLKLEKPLNLEPATFGDSDEIRVGNKVFAIGNPFGLGTSVSLGIISAKERDIEKGPYDSFIQTDASINQGNSGGPLFNMNGEIIGMNTAIFSTDGQNIGVGFATPSNIVQWVVDQLQKHGKVIRGWLGINVQKIKAKDETQNEYLAVSEMVENSPAEKAGLKVGDVIEAFGEISLNNPRIFSLEVAKMAPDTIIPVTIRRDGKVMDLQVKTGIMPEISEYGTKQNETEDGKMQNLEGKKPALKSFSELGIDANSVVNAVDFVQLGFKAYYDDEMQCLVVVNVYKQSDAEKKDLKMGDRIEYLNGNKIYGIDDFKAGLKKTDEAALSVKSANENYMVVLRVEK